jgi:hypothetical protein
MSLNQILPPADLAWARANREGLSAVFVAAEADGEWPMFPELQRRLVQAGKSSDLSAFATQLPPTLGFAHGGDHRIVLLLFGIHLCGQGEWLLDGFLAALHLAAERYRSDEEQPALLATDVDGLIAGHNRRLLLTEVLWREAPFLGSSAYVGDGSVVAREITPDVVRYLSIETVEDYLTMRASELASLPQRGWLLPANAAVAARVEEENPPVTDGADLLGRTRRRSPLLALFATVFIGLVSLSPVIDLSLPVTLAILVGALAITAFLAWPEVRTRRLRWGLVVAVGIVAVLLVLSLRTASSDPLTPPQRAAAELVLHELQISSLRLGSDGAGRIPATALPLPIAAWSRYQGTLAEPLNPAELQSVALYYDLAAETNANPYVLTGDRARRVIAALRRQLRPALVTLSKVLD